MSSPRVADIPCVIRGFWENLTAPGGAATSARAVSNNAVVSLTGSLYYQGSDAHVWHLIARFINQTPDRA